MPYEAWLKMVDFILAERLDITSEELDIDGGESRLREMHEEGLNPHAAVNTIIAENDLFDNTCEDCE